MKKVYADEEDRIKGELLTTEYFLKEIHSFRKIMCSTEYSLEQKEKAYEGLLYIYVATPDLDLEGPEVMFFNATTKDWEIRRTHEMLRGL